MGCDVWISLPSLFTYQRESTWAMKTASAS